jgi:tRNA(Ile)-lysidine synthase
VHKLAQNVLGYIRKNDLLRAGDRVGVAVSGGADSVALLRLMLSLRDELGIVLSVVHLNHKLRGEESDADEQFVRELAATHGLEVRSDARDVKAHAAEKKLGLETAAREVRYEFFRCVLKSGTDRIATAHTLDDQAETVLLKLVRGAGTRGLAGIYPKLEIRHQPSAIHKPGSEGFSRDAASIVRPLLGIQRFRLREYLAEIGQSWREDATNQDLRHTRNRLRHEILPLIEKEVNPSFCQVLAETAEIARVEEEFWIAEVYRILPQVWRDSEFPAIKHKTLRSFPLALQRRLVRATAESLGLTLEFHHVEEILSLADEGQRVRLPGGWTAQYRGGEIEFIRSPEETANGYEYQLPVPGKVFVPEAGTEIEAVLIRKAEENQKYSSEHLVGESFVQHGLVIRNWGPGERFWPAHSKEPRKIKELLQDRHITGERKRLWPVVASGDEIVWVRGLGVRRDFQADNGQGILIREAD